MLLIDEWRTLAPKLWSIRLSVVAAVLGAAEVAVPYLAPAVPSGRFATLAALVSLGAALSRIVAQPKATGT